MSYIVFEFNDGQSIKTEVDRPETVMFYAQQAGVERVVGRCGGYAACGTCHLYDVSGPEVKDSPPAELELLENVGETVQPNSRLSCQIEVDPQSPPMKFHVPNQ